MRYPLIAITLALSACSTLSLGPDEIRKLPSGYICEILAPDSGTVISNEQRIQLYGTLEQRNYRCDTSAWAQKKAAKAQEKECGMRPIPEFNCIVSKCVNGKWEQICE